MKDFSKVHKDWAMKNVQIDVQIFTQGDNVCGL